MKNVLLYPNPTRDTDLQVTKDTAKALSHLGFSVHISSDFFIGDGFTYYRERPSASCDLMIVIGGDGTLIDAMPTALALDLPILGINLGKVGYLNELEPSELSLLMALCDGNYTVEERLLMDAEVSVGGVCQHHAFPMLNDLVVSRKIENSIATLRVRYNGSKALDYRADGVVISTPLGSTAYALSCGGPMLAHELQAISLTPICAHSFINRSMVFPDNALIEVENLGEHSLVVIADGRTFAELPNGAVCSVKKSKSTLKMISIKGAGHLQSIFKKLRKIQNF